MTPPIRARTADMAVAAAILCLLVAQAVMLLTTNVNWDEFYFLALVHDHLRGDLAARLQTFHVHLLAWLARLPADELGQVLAGRGVMMACEAAVTALVYLIARRWVARRFALIAALAYLSSGFVMVHGMSFRADPLTAFLLMSALYLVVASRLGPWQVLGVAGLLSLAVLVTMKAVLYAPAFLGALIWRHAEGFDGKRLLGRAAAGAMAAGILTAGLYLWHDAQLAGAAPLAPSAKAGSAFAKVFLEQTLLPQPAAAALWSGLSVAAIVLAVVGIGATARGGDGRRAMALCLLAAPVLSIVFYRNAFPYFFPFITPPLMIAAAVGAEAMARRRVVLAALVVLMAYSGLLQASMSRDQGQAGQRATLAAVHALFPDPVPYIDRNSMVASFPKQGFFMSSWGLETYRARNRPVFADILRRTAPPFLIANAPALTDALEGRTEDAPWRLLPADAAVLRENFIHHWGPIWIAGKTLRVDPAPAPVDILVAGPYTLEAAGPVTLNGARVPPGATVHLDEGRHTIASDRPRQVTLRWGERLPVPDHGPAGPIYWGF